MKQQQGFSLIELLIVVGIIGALTAIAVPAFEKYREKSEVTAAIASVKSMRTAIDISISEKSADFPADDAALKQLGDPGIVEIVGTPSGAGGTLKAYSEGFVHVTYSRDGTTGAWECKYNNKTASLSFESVCEKDTSLAITKS